MFSGEEKREPTLTLLEDSTGDIHGGGQLSLDFIHRGLNLSSLMEVPYIRGVYKNGGAQLYMNRAALA